jgi:hypothetical protein
MLTRLFWRRSSGFTTDGCSVRIASQHHLAGNDPIAKTPGEAGIALLLRACRGRNSFTTLRACRGE